MGAGKQDGCLPVPEEELVQDFWGRQARQPEVQTLESLSPGFESSLLILTSGTRGQGLGSQACVPNTFLTGGALPG